MQSVKPGIKICILNIYLRFHAACNKIYTFSNKITKAVIFIDCTKAIFTILKSWQSFIFSIYFKPIASSSVRGNVKNYLQ